jgi:MerR family transcriptional regulator, light-induced transcriptional regulator
MTRTAKRPAPDRETLSIGALARATRIPVETLRTWERRYGAPRPIRKPSGHRVYPAATVDHLRRVTRLLALGHRPAELLGLTVAELDALAAVSGPAPPAREVRAPVGAETPEQTVRDLVRATSALDRETVLDELRASWAKLGPVPFFDEVAGPFLVAIGGGWAEGALAVRHEHFASAVLSDFLRGVREPFDRRARGPAVVAATLPGEAHDGGLLMASVILAMRGRRVLYLGADTPIEEIVATARAGNAEAVCVSVSGATPRARAAAALARLRAALPRRVPAWVGGAGAPAVPGVERFASVGELDARLATS